MLESYTGIRSNRRNKVTKFTRDKHRERNKKHKGIPVVTRNRTRSKNRGNGTSLKSKPCHLPSKSQQKIGSHVNATEHTNRGYKKNE
jgi:hypothetical protein